MNKKDILKKYHGTDLKGAKLKGGAAIMSTKLEKLYQIREYLDDISEYLNPDGGSAYTPLTNAKRLITSLISEIFNETKGVT